LQRDAEGENLCQELIHAHPDQASGYVALADGLLSRRFRGTCELPRIQRAICVLEQAMARPVKDADNFDLAQRLSGARELLAKATATAGQAAGS